MDSAVILWSCNRIRWFPCLSRTSTPPPFASTSGYFRFSGYTQRKDAHHAAAGRWLCRRRRTIWINASINTCLGMAARRHASTAPPPLCNTTSSAHEDDTVRLTPVCACVFPTQKQCKELVNTFQTKPRGGDSVLKCAPRRSHCACTHNLRFSYSMRATTTTVTAAAGSMVIYSLWFLRARCHQLDWSQTLNLFFCTDLQ